MKKTTNLLKNLLILTSSIVTKLLSNICEELDIYFGKSPYIYYGTKLVPVARASPRSHTIQILYPYSLHMCMKYWSVHQ